MKRGREKKNKKWVLVLVVILLVAASAAAVSFYLIYRSTESSRVCTTYIDSRDKQCASDYIGLNKQQAEELAKKHGLYIKYSTINGESAFNVDIGADSVWFDLDNDIVLRVCFESVRYGWPHEGKLCYPKTLEELLYSK